MITAKSQKAAKTQNVNMNKFFTDFLLRLSGISRFCGVKNSFLTAILFKFEIF